MNYPRDQGQRLGGTSHSSIYQHGTLSTSPFENSPFKRLEISKHQRASNNPLSIGPHSAPSSGLPRMADRPYTPTRASTLGSADHLDRSNIASQSDYARSEDLNHGGSARNNNNNYGGRDPGPSPAFMSSSRPTTPGNSGQQQQQQQYQASSSGHSEHSERRLSTASQSSESGAASKSTVPSSNAATSFASS